MRKLTLSIVAATLATAGVALAAPGMGGHQMPQGDMTRAQAQAMAAEHFAKMDVNGDGKLDKTDREAMRAQMQEKMFDRIDADNDGSISKSEFEAMHRGHREGAREGKRGDQAGMAGHRMGGKRGHGMRGGAGMMAKMADTNGDGTIDQAEFTAAAMKRFDRVDADHNGIVTQAERTAAREAMKAKWQERRAARQAAQPAN